MMPPPPQVLSPAQRKWREVREGRGAWLAASEHRLHRRPRFPFRALHSAQRSPPALC